MTKAPPLALIDYGAGNLHSVHNALRAAGAEQIEVTSDPEMVLRAGRIVLPGVGAFGACKDGLDALDGMIEALTQRVLADGVPFLGICVGMQLLADEGLEHGRTPGLGWIGGSVRVIDPQNRQSTSEGRLRVPHMGWNDVVLAQDHIPVIEPGEAYFLHSYHFEPAQESDIAAWSDHGGPIVAAIARDNILGVQFHPEKSQAFGLALLRRFLSWKG